jgi:hypothetical protein
MFSAPICVMPRYLVLDGCQLPLNPFVLSLQSLDCGQILGQVIHLQLLGLLRDPVAHVFACYKILQLID